MATTSTKTDSLERPKEKIQSSITWEMSKDENQQTAIGCLYDVEFQLEKMLGLLSFMGRLDEDNPPETDDIKNAFLALQDLAREARHRQRDFWRHYDQFQKGCGGVLSPTAVGEKGE